MSSVLCQVVKMKQIVDWKKSIYLQTEHLDQISENIKIIEEAKSAVNLVTTLIQSVAYLQNSV